MLQPPCAIAASAAHAENMCATRGACHACAGDALQIMPVNILLARTQIGWRQLPPKWKQGWLESGGRPETLKPLRLEPHLRLRP